MKVLVTGASGQLGNDVCAELCRRNIDCLGTSSKSMDITKLNEVNRVITEYKPDAVIHCAAFTKVDAAEEEAIKCWSVNADGTRNIAEVCFKNNVEMMYISTDYVFSGTGNQYYDVSDPVNPCNVYGASKLAGELVVQAFLKRYYIVRVSWVFGENGNNFVKTMLKLAKSRHEINVVSDQIGSPTYTKDLAVLLCDMIQSKKYGRYHATNEGSCSWAEFAKQIFLLTRTDVIVNPILSCDYPTKATRPLNSRLNKQGLDEAGFKRLPHWQNALLRYLHEEREKSE